MPKFDLIKIEDIVGTIPMYKLRINNNCPFDDFWNAVLKDGNNSESREIRRRLEFIANNHSIQGNKFHKLSGNNDTWTEFEIKTKHFRVYLFHIRETGKIVVCGGKKTSQKKDINYFRRLKNQFKEQYYGTI